MGAVRILSSETIQALLSTDSVKPPNHNLCDSTDHKIDLTPWDLQVLPHVPIQEGLLYPHNPIPTADTQSQIHRLKTSLSTTLSIFPPLAGRLEIIEHEDNTISCSIICNNAGALFVHAAADNTTVADILKPTYLPLPILHSFFPLNGVKNYQATSQPLLAVQVTELVDGIFIAFTINHVAVDGTSFWHFINSWAEISRSGCLQISKSPTTLERWFPNDTQRPIRFPFTAEPPPQKKKNNNNGFEDEKLSERLFHFAKEKIAKLKSKANAEAGVNKISSLQALLTHIWRSFTRSKRFDPQEEVNFVLDIGVRPRLVPPLQEGYFGNAIVVCWVTMKAGELLEEGGLGKGAWEMNKMIALHTDEKLKKHYESWLRTPSFIGHGDEENSNSLVISLSPWFDVYGNDFGWGKPVGVRSGGSNRKNGMLCVFAGTEEKKAVWTLKFAFLMRFWRPLEMILSSWMLFPTNVGLQGMQKP